jgi:hypothetical protein
MKNRIKTGNIILLISFIIILIASSCSEKVYTANNSIGKSSSGKEHVANLSDRQNFHSVLRRTDPDRKFMWVFQYPEFLR